MKALITAFALLSFVAATTVPTVVRAADSQTQQTTAKKTMHSKKKHVVKKTTAKSKTAKKTPMKKKASTG